MRTNTIAYRTTPITIYGGDYDLYGYEVEVVYEIDGADYPGSRWEPPERATWLIHEVYLTDEAIKAYNEASDEDGFPRLPIEPGTNIFPLLDKEQLARLEADLEDEDRHEFEDSGYYDNYDPDDRFIDCSNTEGYW